jgi:chromate transporter
MTSFGGPVAHLAHFRERCVQRLRWIDDAQYAQLVACCHALPGPTSSQAGFLLGWLRAGPLGAVAAWVAFTAPSAAVMILLAIALGSSADPSALGWIAGIKAIVPAVVLHAVVGMARMLCRGAARVAIAIAAGGITIAWSHPLEQLVAIAIGALAGLAVLGRPSADAPMPQAHPLRISPMPSTACAALLAIVVVGALLVRDQRVTPYVSAGALVFGGGHVVLPLLEADLVPGTVDQSRFLAGYGAAQAIPGPLFTIASYLGASTAIRAGDPAGISVMWGIAATAAIFAPGLLLAASAWPVWSALSRAPHAMRALAGVQAAVTGILAAALIEIVVPASLAPAGRADLWLCTIAALAFVALRWGTPSWLVTVAGSLLGTFGS